MVGPTFGISSSLPVGVHERFQRAEVFGKRLGRGLADLRDAERIEKARECRVLLRSRLIEQVLRGFLAHTFQRREFIHFQVIKIGDGLDHFLFDQLLHQLVTQTFDVHGATTREMQNRPCALCRAIKASGAVMRDFALPRG